MRKSSHVKEIQPLNWEEGKTQGDNYLYKAEPQFKHKNFPVRSRKTLVIFKTNRSSFSLGDLKDCRYWRKQSAKAYNCCLLSEQCNPRKVSDMH